MTTPPDARLLDDLDWTAMMDEVRWRDDHHVALKRLTADRAARAELLAAAEARVARLREALNKIASWREGPVVTSAFDEPGAASVARAALAEEP